MAIDQDALEYIKYGNGQVEPPQIKPSNDNGTEEVTEVAPPATTAISLQSFYESLPQPFPEAVGDMTAAEINGPAWINTILQTSRGGQFRISFTWVTDGALGRK